MSSIQVHMYEATIQMTSVGRQFSMVSHFSARLGSKILYVGVLDIGEFTYPEMKAPKSTVD